MNRIFAFSLFFCFATAHAIVSEGKAQMILISRDASNNLVFTVKTGESFADVDSCAKYCYKRSWFQNQDSPWANLVHIHFDTILSEEDRQYVGDRFVANKVYPKVLIWKEGEEVKKTAYQPDDKSYRDKRKLK